MAAAAAVAEVVAVAVVLTAEVVVVVLLSFWFCSLILSRLDLNKPQQRKEWPSCSIRTAKGPTTPCRERVQFFCSVFSPFLGDNSYLACSVVGNNLNQP